MYIDFHTHIFPSNIASRVLRILQNNAKKQGNVATNPCTDGTAEGLRRSMKLCGVLKSVALPIATKVTQSESINSFASSVNSEDIVAFGSVHPMQPDWEDVLNRLAENGFKGIKLHPQYQQVPVNGKETLRVLKKAEKLGLYTTIHAGVDFGQPPLMCTPSMLSDVLDEVSGKFIIAAHLGGFQMWDEAEELLVGRDIIFDTAMVGSFIGSDQYKRIIKNHGSNKVLFASDSPWENPSDTINALKSLELNDSDYENIFYKNALGILGL